MDIVSLFAGNGIVWMAGLALVLLVPVRTGAAIGGDGTAPWVFGCAWFVGTFALTLWMRALSLASVPFSVAAVGTPLALVAIAGMWLARRNARVQGLVPGGDHIEVLAGKGLAGWRRTLWLMLLAWLALRFALLLGEVLMRPLYPWDAWTQWSTKARVWFELRSMAPFLPMGEWMQPGSVGYVDAAPHYPATVPLLQVWSALLIGSWNDVLVNLPWCFTGVAFAFGIYGFMALRGLQPFWALLATWLVASLPILNVHVALAGYADLSMATFLTLGVLAGMQWFASRQWRDAALAIVLLAACVTIKNPGKAWLIVLLPGLVTALMPRLGLRMAAAGIAVAVLIVMVLAQTNAYILGYQLRLNFVSPWQGLSEAYFLFGNWHLLWYGAVGVAVLGRRHLFDRELAPLTVVIGSGLLFLFFGFAFTHAAQWVADQSTVNRATLHLAPLIAVWMVLVFRRWWQARAPVATAEVVPV